MNLGRGLFIGWAIFAANWWAFLVPHLPQETGCAPSLGARDTKNLSRAIPWLTFLLQPKAR
jgi:hypothetical protein